MTTPPLIPSPGSLDAESARTPIPPPKPGNRLPPGLPYPLFAYVFKPWVKLGSPILLFEYLRARFGNICQYSFLGTTIVFLNDPAYIREVLINQASAFVKERTVRRMKVLLGEGLITADDPIHMRQRKIAAPAFHRQRIAAYAGAIANLAQARADSWQLNQTIDIAAQSMELSLEIVARTLFDLEVSEDIRSINTEVNTIMDLYNFIVAFPRLEDFLHLPIPGIVKFRNARQRLDTIVNRIIRARRAELAATPDAPDRGDLLSMLLLSRYEDEGSGAPTGMSDEQIRDEVLTIFLAGYETVANALTWTWHLLSQNPTAEARLHQELDQVLGTPTDLPSPSVPRDMQSTHPGPANQLSSRPERSEVERPASPTQASHPSQPGAPGLASETWAEPPTTSAAGSPGPASETWAETPQPSREQPRSHRLPTLADLPNLPYTEQVFAESMRLFPPAWAMGRMSTRPVTLGPYTIPPGAHFFFSQYIMGRDEQYFPDPLRFDPDRHTPEAKAARDKFVYFPFGGGGRQCIGESFAWMEGILAIATIASRWRLRYTDNTPPVPQAKITLRPRDPLHMQVTPR